MQGNGKSAGARTFRSVLADLDDAFALAPRPTRIESCPCCTTAEEIAVLLSKPRKLLSANKLQGYDASSMTTIGSAQDLRYFTPRILELCHTGEMIWPDIEILYDHLRRADWKSWPESGIVAELMKALWTDVLTEYPALEDPAALLCALGSADGSVARQLASWSLLETGAAIRNLRDFLIDDVGRRRGRLVPDNAFWDVHGNAYRELAAWLSDGGAKAAIEDAFARATDGALLELLAESHEVVVAIQP